MLIESQLAALSVFFRKGSEEASAALSRWLDRPARVSFEQVEQVTLAAASDDLGDPEQPICCCVMGLQGRVAGQLLLAFEDASGLALADLILGNRLGTSMRWGEVEQSAVLETANIVGCTYLNSLARRFPETDDVPGGLLPSPPRFVRDFAEALLQFALLDQAMASDMVFLTRTEFCIENAPVNCRLLFVPDAQSLSALREMPRS